MKFINLTSLFITLIVLSGSMETRANHTWGVTENLLPRPRELDLLTDSIIISSKTVLFFKKGDKDLFSAIARFTDLMDERFQFSKFYH